MIIAICILAALLAAFIVAAVLSTRLIRTTHIEFTLDNLPDEFDGCHFAQISDLHNSVFGRNNKKLIERIRKTNPIALLVTGDVTAGLSYVNPQKSSFYRLCQNLNDIPVFFTLGNHEERLVRKLPDMYENLLTSFSESGINVLDDKKASLDINGAHINIYGLSIRGVRHHGDNKYHFDTGLFGNQLKPEKGAVNILMAHIPQFFEEYAKQEFDIVLSGHMHGGIIQIPHFGGLLSPERKFFPEYCYGLYEKGKTKMFISAGLGKSIIPFRLFCRPEVVEITLKKGHR